MTVLGGNQQHKWGGGSTEIEDDPVYIKYHKNNDIAGQFLEEDSVSDVCILEEGYYKKHQRKPHTFLVKFLNKIKKIF